ncbi:MAG: hypothetical protein ACOH14_06405 [Rhodoglobus sp.]
MAGTPSTPQAGQKPADQVAADEKAAADLKAVEEQAAAEKAAAEKKAEAEKVAAEKKAAADQAAADKPEPKPKGYVVTGAAVILRTEDGGERYLYRGAPIDSGAFAKESIKHAVSVGLIEKAK